jgi:hypothetical protein
MTRITSLLGFSLSLCFTSAQALTDPDCDGVEGTSTARVGGGQLVMGTGKLLVDQSHGNGFDITYLTDWLVPQGWTVDEVFSGPITEAALAPYDIFLVPVSLGGGISSFSASEAAAVGAFVAGGKGLFAFGEYNTNPAGMNSLTAQFGVTFHADVVSDPTNNEYNTTVWPTIYLIDAHPVTTGVSSYTYYAGCCVSVTSPSSVIATGDADAYSAYCPSFPPVLAVYESGGRAVFSGDETPIFGQQSEPMLLPNIMNWLLGGATGGMGACCLADGSCVDGLDWITCSSSGGVFQGTGSACANVQCPPPPPPGACCLPDGSCADGMSRSECIASGGNFQLSGSTCATVSCSPLPPTGACCLADGSCAEGMTQAACQSNGGVFQGTGTTCAGVQCPQPSPGACCYASGSCTDGLTLSACQTSGGVFQGSGSTCAGTGCAPVPFGPYGWTISSSLSNPFVNTGTATGGVNTLYLWFVCSGLSNGLTAAEFNISGPPSSIFAFTPMNGFLNAGGTTNLLLATPCTLGSVVAGNWVILSLPGEY